MTYLLDPLPFPRTINYTRMRASAGEGLALASYIARAR